MGSVLCEHCAAACCKYLAIEIDKPSGANDYDDLRWYLMHEGVIVFVEDGDWYLQITTRCKALGPDNQCTTYDTRPRICGDYKAADCDYTDADDGYDLLFTHAKQIEEYCFKKTGKQLGRQSTTPRRGKKARPKRGSCKRRSA